VDECSKNAEVSIEPKKGHGTVIYLGAVEGLPNLLKIIGRMGFYLFLTIIFSKKRAIERCWPERHSPKEPNWAPRGCPAPRVQNVPEVIYSSPGSAQGGIDKMRKFLIIKSINNYKLTNESYPILECSFGGFVREPLVASQRTAGGPLQIDPREAPPPHSR
jgi:hypothetical protein